ncbi:MAG: hypothetical protein Q4A04_08450 [Eubacteriales bacterium]|nr:hypothetical protein [Eubacteriales bacterium]
MGFLDHKIESTDITTFGVVAAPDRMRGTAEENKKVFDRLIRDSVKGDFNAIIDLLVAATAASELGFSRTEGINADNIQAAIEVLYASGEAGVAKAIEEALKAEGYAVGKQNGTDVTGGEYFHNNAKYYKEQAAGSATSAAGSAGTASQKANEASQSAASASGSASSASGSASAAAGSASSAEGSAEAAAGSAGTASQKANEASQSASAAESSAQRAEEAAESVENPVSYYPQTGRTDSEKAQARSNIGLGFLSVIDGKIAITVEV